jgi:hypothetical protein
MMAVMRPLLILPLLCFSIVATPVAAQLPFDSIETSGPLKLVVRHRLEWNPRSGVVSWDRLEADLPGRARLTVEPGRFDPRSTEPTKVGLHVDLADGTLDARPEIGPRDRLYIPVSVRVGPRDVKWLDPPIEVKGLAVQTEIVQDSRSIDSPLPTLRSFEISEMKIDSIVAGPYRLDSIGARLAWNNPDWRLDRLEARLFDGFVRLEGNGYWGTDGPPRVSLSIESRGIDLQRLLEAMQIPRADEVRARLEGTLRVEAVGRQWRIMDFDMRGAPGSVYLSRRMIYDALAPKFGATLSRAEIEAILDRSFGPEFEMMPFFQSGLSGGLSAESLDLDLRVENRPMRLRVEPRIERELLWEIFDSLLKTGLDRIKGVGAGPPPPAGGRTP